MSVKYSIAELRNPAKPLLAKKFYAKAQVRDVIDLDRIAAEIAFSTSLTDGDVLNALRNLTHKLKEHLADGDIVKLGEFGSFQYQLSSKGADTEKEFVPANIVKARIQFRPGSMVKDGQESLRFEKTLPMKVKSQLPVQPEGGE